MSKSKLSPALTHDEAMSRLAKLWAQDDTKRALQTRQKHVCKRLTIVARGDSEVDFDSALSEAMRCIGEGFTSGGNSNDSSGFYFDVSENVPKAEQPA